MWTLNFLARFKALAPLFLRAAIGFSFFWMHGRDKIMPGGEFDGGKGFASSGIAAEWLLYVAAWTEFLAGAALLLGLLSRWACIGLLCVMGYAIFKVHAGQPYDNIEKAIAYAAGLLALLVTGPGPMSVDKHLLKSAGV